MQELRNKEENCSQKKTSFKLCKTLKMKLNYWKMLKDTVTSNFSQDLSKFMQFQSIQECPCSGEAPTAVWQFAFQLQKGACGPAPLFHPKWQRHRCRTAVTRLTVWSRFFLSNNRRFSDIRVWTFAGPISAAIGRYTMAQVSSDDELVVLAKRCC